MNAALPVMCQAHLPTRERTTRPVGAEGKPPRARRPLPTRKEGRDGKKQGGRVPRENDKKPPGKKHPPPQTRRYKPQSRIHLLVLRKIRICFHFQYLRR